MLKSIHNAFREARAAWSHAEYGVSGTLLASDFILSRLLALGKLPGHNASRRVRIKEGQINYRFNRGDLQSVREVLLEECYRLPFLLEPQNILDLGANIGLTSLWMWKQFHPRKIIAVECDPDNAAVTRLNFRDNGIPGEVIEAAVGGANGIAEFAPDRASNLGRLLTHVNPESRAPDTVTVPMISLPDLLTRFDGQRVDLIKMDIEGAEEAVFSGDLSWLQSVHALIVEMHEDRVDVSTLTQRVADSGFKVMRTNTGHQDNLYAFLKL